MQVNAPIYCGSCSQCRVNTGTQALWRTALLSTPLSDKKLWAAVVWRERVLGDDPLTLALLAFKFQR